MKKPHIYFREGYWRADCSRLQSKPVRQGRWLLRLAKDYTGRLNLSMASWKWLASFNGWPL